MLAGPSRQAVALTGPLAPSTIIARTAPLSRQRLHTSRRILYAPPPPQQHQQPQPPTEPRNEALEYLEAKRLRKEWKAGQPPSRHALFYREIVPALLRILAYGSSSYFALHLLWNLLDREEQRTLADAKSDTYAQEIRKLDEQIEQTSKGVAGRAVEGVRQEAGALRAKADGWTSWLWPFERGKKDTAAEPATA